MVTKSLQQLAVNTTPTPRPASHPFLHKLPPPLPPTSPPLLREFRSRIPPAADVYLVHPDEFPKSFSPEASSATYSAPSNPFFSKFFFLAFPLSFVSPAFLLKNLEDDDESSYQTICFDPRRRGPHPNPGLLEVLDSAKREALEKKRPKIVYSSTMAQSWQRWKKKGGMANGMSSQDGLKQAGVLLKFQRE